jgi:hypothetical protein
MTVPCPVCAGYGWWDRLTGHPFWINQVKHPTTDLTRCPYCEGRGSVPRWETSRVY